MLDIFLLVSFVKLLFINSYRSTDFEVHRNWLAITHSTNISRWYYEDLSEWTLDYPPMFAYFEYLLSFVAKFFDPKMLVVENLNYASDRTILFQRLSVIVTDCVYYLGVKKCLANVPVSQRTYHAVILLANVGLIFVDHIHFQYNGILFGILLLSCGFMLEQKYLKAALFYTILLNMKHIFIYIAPVYFFYLLKVYCCRNFSFKSFTGCLLKLAAAVLIPTAISLGPFVSHVPQLITRLFPFKRGLTHAYWAPNFWAFYNFIDKALSIVKKLPQDNSNTGGLVQQFDHKVLPSISPQVTFVVTLLAMIPCCVKIATFKNFQAARDFMSPLIICAATSFMFGWHVHEKAILMVLIPLQILTALLPAENGRFSLFLTIFGIYSITPLLYVNEMILVKLSLWTTYVGFNIFAFSTLKIKEFNVLEKLYSAGLLILPIYEFFIQHLIKFDVKFPFMPLMLTSVYCSMGMMYFWLMFYAKYLFAKEKVKNK